MTYLSGSWSSEIPFNPIGHAYPQEGGVIVPVAASMRDFYVDDGGFLWSKNPFPVQVSKQPLTSFGVTPSSKFRAITEEDRRKIGLSVFPNSCSGLFFEVG